MSIIWFREVHTAQNNDFLKSSCVLGYCSDTDSGVGNGKGFLKGIVSVSSDEVLEQEFRVSEIWSVVLEWLSMASHESLLEISSEPNPLLHVLTTEKVFSFLD